jgi:hypothetical protein
MASHLLGVLQPAVVFQVNGDAGCSPGVTSYGVIKPPPWPASGSQPRRCSGSKHVPSPPFQRNLRSKTRVARFEVLWPQCTRSGSARAGDVRAYHAPCRLLTTYFGPRTECAGFDRVICRTTRKSYNIRTAASFSLMVGLDPGKSSIQAATWNGRTVMSSRP